MPNIVNLFDTKQQNLNTNASRDTEFFSILDLKYAYSQLNLDPDTVQHCNFNIVSGEVTGKYRFNTGFFGLTYMRAAFQKVMDYTLVGFNNTHCFLDEIIIVSQIKCDASRAGLGAALKQRSPTRWHTFAFASRFLNSNEERYSINGLELLGVVWSVDYFEYYLFGKSFTVIADHRALLSIMKEHRSNKYYNSGLTRWVDRLLPFDFKIQHIPG